jgi:CRISPR/Cas system-associated exonuclease Cas4 (RecB family)
MESFLEKTAEYIYTRHKDNLDRVCLVSPNRRASLYLRKYFARLIEKPIWLPEMITVEDFILKHSGYALIDSLSLLFELHAIHLEIEGENAQSFEKFMQWGQLLLNDFNEVDLYLADSRQLYNYLSEDKALELWNPSGEPLTEFEKNYLTFFKSMLTYYTWLKEHLDKKHQAWQGMAYRKLAEDVSWMDHLDCDKIYFIGFNALTRAEEIITTKLQRMDKAVMLWDADPYYVNNPVHEAGRFLRQYMSTEKDGSLHWLENHFTSGARKITILGIPNKVTQAKEAGQLIKSLISEHKDLTGTALVLADETLLLPVLNSIPEESGEFNITMGFSLTYTPLYGFIDAIFGIHSTSAQFSSTHSEPRFYTKEIIKFLIHPYVINLGGGITQTQTIIAKLRETRIPFIPLSRIIDASKDEKMIKILRLLLDKSWQTTTGALEKLIELTDLLRISFSNQTEKKKDKKEIKSDSSNDFPIEEEYFFAFARILQRLKDMHLAYTALNKTETLRQIILQMMKQEKIPFYGEPLKGIQIMGMLETRTLDFERVIILGANDDLLPGARKHDSFIPYNIKKEFGIPIYTDKDAVMAYHFYRLLQRAEEVWLFYNTEPNELGGGDKSRFILQLLQELPKANPNVIIENSIISLSPASFPDKEGFTIQKTVEVLKKLEEKAKMGLSPTTLSKYVNCSLQFYFSEVQGLAEVEEIEDTIDARVMGTVIHKVLQDYYQEYINQYVTVEHLQLMLKEVSKRTQKAFEENDQFKGSFNEGKNLLIAKVSELYITNFLKKELAVIKESHQTLLIKNLEEKISTHLEITLNNEEHSTLDVLIKGTIDRIDQLGDDLRLIDYKTGNIDPRADIKLTDPEDLITNPKKSKVLQLLIYKYLIEKNPQLFNGSFRQITPGIISLRKVASYMITLEEGSIWENNESGYQNFEEVLKNLIEQIFDTSIPFVATTDKERCKFCPFNSICNR